MNIKIIKKIPGTRWEVGRVIKVTNEGGRRYIEEGYAEATDHQTPEDIMMSDVNHEIEENRTEKVIVEHRIAEGSEDSTESEEPKTEKKSNSKKSKS